MLIQGLNRDFWVSTFLIGPSLAQKLTKLLESLQTSQGKEGHFLTLCVYVD